MAAGPPRHRQRPRSSAPRPATGPNVKFSNSPGKETLRGYLRVYGRGDTLIVADARETIDGEPLFVKLVEQGRVVYARVVPRAGRPGRPHLGPVHEVGAVAAGGRVPAAIQAMRAAEIAAAKARLG